MFQGIRIYFSAFMIILWLLPITVAAASLKPIKIAFYDKPHDPVLTSISLQVWSKAASVLPINYVALHADSKQQALTWLKNGKVRLVVGPLKMDNSDPGLDFVNSYVPDAIGIIIPDRSHISFMGTIRGYFEALFGMTVASIALVMFIFGVVIWWVERKKNSAMYVKSPWRGIGDSVWQCLVTFSTVGYGDIVPKTLLGRILSGLWIIISLFLVSAFVASITSELTYMKTRLDNLTSLSQLYEEKVGLISGSQDPLLMARRYHVTPVFVANLKTLVNDVSQQELKAGFENFYVLKNYLNIHPHKKVILTHYMLSQGNYAFVLRLGDPLQPRLTRVLYTLSEIGHIKEAIESVVGPIQDAVKKG